ncbi:MAG TPA: glycosyltransferase family 2 protein [Pyrinomonadaceae bacterium]|nr:glycosyltransferase family 2 protein [Pyrinomonadaceae bacterium]
MSTCPLVTIAIPTYNRAESYFPSALQSALSQTYSNIEIVVSDNCSNDHTQAMVRAIKDPRIRYFRHDPGIGQRNNYNFCFEQAKGSYVLLLHDDDLIDDDFVSSCMHATEGTAGVGIIRTGMRTIDAHGDIIAQVANDVVGLPLDAFFRRWLAGKTPIYCCNTLFNTHRLREMGGFTSRHFCYPDTMAIFRLAAQYGRIDIPDVKASFRFHGDQAGFSRRISEWCEDSLDLLHLMCDLAPQSKKEILKQGVRRFARGNYDRATCARSPWERAVATMKVMRYFRYRQLPRISLVLQILDGTRLYNALRIMKRCAVRPLRGIAAR